MDDQQVEKLCAGIATATALAVKQHLASIPSKKNPSWVAVGTMMLAAVVPICSFTFSLSSRLAVVESKQSDLSDASTQIARLTQKIEDFQREFEDYRTETSGLIYHHQAGESHDAPQARR